uniref:Uncharacterized protein n=1 Tax=Arundo donax TaxID=35708 RepID=A0A0A9FBL9_ARUDO
MSLCIQLLF